MIKNLFLTVALSIFMLSGCSKTPDIELKETQTKMSGMYSYMADAGIFKDCSSAKKYPVAFEDDYISLERAYLNTKHQAGEAIKVNLIGKIELRDGMDNQKNIPTLVVKKFINIIPKEHCQNPHSKAKLENTYWKATIVGDTPVPRTKRREAYIIFSQGIVKGNSGCNGLGGKYILNGNKLSFSDKGFMSTRMFCKGSIEPQFLKALKKIDNYKIDSEYLELFDKDGNRLIRFESVYLQ